MSEPLRSILLLVGQLVTLLAWYRVPRPRGRVLNVLAVMALASGLMEAYGIVTVQLGVQNAAVYNAYFLLDMALVLALLHAVWPQARPLVAAVALLVVSVWLATTTMATEERTLDTERIMAAAVVQALAVLVVLWHLAQRSEWELHRVPAFWALMGLMVYFGGMPPMMGIIRWLFATDPDTARQLWSIMPVLALLRYLLAAWACLQATRNAAHGTQ